MRDDHQLLFVDEFALSFHMHFYRLLKWLLAAPFAAAAIALLALPNPEARGLETLPSFASSLGSPMAGMSSPLGSGHMGSGLI